LLADSYLGLLVLDVSGKTAALPMADVERVLPIAQLAHVPGSPATVAGILNFRGAAVPVLRLDLLLGLAPQEPGLYSAVVVLKRGLLEDGGLTRGGPVGLLVDRVTDIRRVPESALLAVRDEDSFNGCASAVVSTMGDPIPLLSPRRLLLEQEARRLTEFQQVVQQRLPEWETFPQ
jgi:purine-binding chemotaxis protein CheW